MIGFLIEIRRCGVPLFSGFMDKIVLAQASSRGGNTALLHVLGFEAPISESLWQSGSRFELWGSQPCSRRHRRPTHRARSPFILLRPAATCLWRAVNYLTVRTPKSARRPRLPQGGVYPRTSPVSTGISSPSPLESADYPGYFSAVLFSLRCAYAADV